MADGPFLDWGPFRALVYLMVGGSRTGDAAEFEAVTFQANSAQLSAGSTAGPRKV